MNRLIVIVGPTAVGKTQISIELAQIISSEIISGDSMLVYKGMDIGTAKPSKEEQAGVIHHLIDFLDPGEEFSVVDFQSRADMLIKEINSRKMLPILAGGTGLYIKALLEGYSFNPVSGSEKIRKELTDLAENNGSEYLHTLLREKDPATAERLHKNDLRRIIRALEVYELSGESVSQSKKSPVKLMYDSLVFCLTMDRAKLYERINQRVDNMFQAGLTDEVKRLLDSGVPINCQAMQGIGYKETAAYLRGEITLTAAQDQIKQATRNFAKRQLTLFRSMPYIHWLDVDKHDNNHKILGYIYSMVAGKFNLG